MVKKDSLIRRTDGRLERLCAHGIGHTISIPKSVKGKKDKEAWWIHGCDGCCKNYKKS